jgi:hypothetical protein
VRTATVEQREDLPIRPADNPFASHRIDGLAYRPNGVTWSALITRLEALGGRAAIVGPEGSGKTTLLEGLARRLSGSIVLIRLGAGATRPWPQLRRALPRPVTRDHVVLVDAAERLRATAWLRLRHATRRARGLVITAHRPGRLPTLIECRGSPELLAELVAELAPGRPARMLDELFHRHDGNIRLCFRELYDRHAAR